MTTPNIENIIKSLVVKAGVMEMGEKIAWGSDTALMRQAAAALQTQAERIAELEEACDKYSEAEILLNSDMAKQIGALRAALANAEPTNSYDLAKRADNGGQP